MKKLIIVFFICLSFIDTVLANNNEKTFIDEYNDIFFNSNSIFIKFVALSNEYNFETMGDLFNKKGKCNSSIEDCNKRPENKFYLKMYDLYYLYLSKYNVKLDLPLIMATLLYSYDEIDQVFEMNLSDYDRKLIVESDWKPTETTTLDWDYDYESQHNYLVLNDSSMDMQILAKNMVAKITVQKCVKDKKVIKSKKIKDYEEDLVCNEGETLEKGTSTYELDLKKYDNFLLEYIEKKFFLNRITLYPVRSEGPNYYSNKKPSVIKKKTVKKAENESDNKDGNYIDGVSFMSGSFGKIYYYNQCEEPYASHSYGGYGTMCGYGCGPTALAIVISSLYDKTIDAIEVNDYLCSSGGCSGDGTYHAAITSTAEHYGLNVNKTGDTQAVIDALGTGDALVIAIMCPGHFTTSGHFITLTGVTSDGKVTVADPASRSRSTDWDYNIVVEETCNSNGSPFWIMTK